MARKAWLNESRYPSGKPLDDRPVGKLMVACHIRGISLLRCNPPHHASEQRIVLRVSECAAECCGKGRIPSRQVQELIHCLMRSRTGRGVTTGGRAADGKERRWNAIQGAVMCTNEATQGTLMLAELY